MSVQSPVKTRRPWWVWALVAVALLGICGIVSNMTGDKATQTAAPADNAPKVADATDAPTAAPTDAPAAPPFGDIEAKRADATDLQWDAYVKTLAGTRAVDWPGIVREVKDAGGGAVKVSVDLTPGGGVFGASDAFIETTNADAANWSKDTPVVVNGTIRRVGSVLGEIVVTFEDGATVAAKP